MSGLRRISYAASIIALVGMTALDSSAQLRVPNLNGHRFIASETVSDPFVNTYIVNQVGLGMATDLDFPLYEFNGDTLFAPRGDLIFAALRFDYQQRIKRWLAVSMSFKTFGRLGTNAGSLLSAGITASTDLRLDWLIKLYENERSALSVDLGFRNSNTTVVDVFSFVEDIIEGEEAKLVDSIPSVHVVGGVRYAYAFSSLLGIKLFGTILYGDKTQNRDSGDELNFEFGGALSIDPRQRFGIPVGALLGYSRRTLSLGLDDNSSDSHEVEVKIEYTKPDDFSFGPSVSWASLPGLYSRVSFVNVAFSSRYYF
jgi:hypothetical protein